MNLLEQLRPYEARWVGRALHLKLSRRTEVVLDSSSVTIDGDPRLELADLQPFGFALRYDTAGPTVLKLGSREVLVENMEDSLELDRVLRAWRDDPAVRAAWGTSALERLLVPELDEQRLRTLGAAQSTNGLEIPARSPVSTSNGWVVPGLVALGATVLVVLFGQPLYLFVVVLGAALVPLLVSDGRVGDRLVLTQHGLILPSGVRVPFHELRSVRATGGGALEFRTSSGDRHQVHSLRGEAVTLAAYLNDRRTAAETEAIPTTIRNLRDREKGSYERRESDA